MLTNGALPFGLNRIRATLQIRTLPLSLFFQEFVRSESALSSATYSENRLTAFQIRHQKEASNRPGVLLKSDHWAVRKSTSRAEPACNTAIFGNYCSRAVSIAW
jgi:hypothetical protein